MEEGSKPTDPPKGSKVRLRAKTISSSRLNAEERQTAQELDYNPEEYRPQTRGECTTALGIRRPCPYVSCSHHLYLDVNPDTGAIKLNFPHLEVWEMKHTCSLDVADLGGITLEEVGAILNITRERVRQVEVKGIINVKREVKRMVGE